MPAVVSDTSVINYLAAVGQTELLRVQFGKVLIPPAVWRELHAKPGLPGTAPANRAETSGWLVVQQPKPSQVLSRLMEELDPGEAEAIALACEIKPAVVLLDEAEGRAAARSFGLQIIGTAGILAAARQAGHLKRIKPLLDRLIQDYRFRLSPELYDQFVTGDGSD
jgi:predicted nucleic acid-binding protein